MSDFFARLLASYFPALVAKAIHQAAGTKRGDDILLKNSVIIGAVIQVAQPLIIKAASTGKVGSLVDSLGGILIASSTYNTTQKDPVAQ